MEQQGAPGAEQAGAVVAPTRAPAAYGHEAFAGTFSTKLEANGRLVVPSALRAPFLAAGSAQLMPNKGALWLFTPQGFEVTVDHVMAQATGAVDPRTRSRLFMSSPKVTVDKQGRLVVPPEQRARLGLEGEADVVLAGTIEHVELWPAATWAAMEAERLGDGELLFEGFGGLPTGPA